jgi:hypothetical protein
MGQAVAVDGQGNMYVTGYFYDRTDFGNGTGLLLSAGAYDMFLAKVSPAGVPLWARRFGGAGDEKPTSIALDASGNIFVGGTFTGTTDLGRGALASAGGLDMFIAKYAADGTATWTKAFGGSGYDSVSSLKADANGNVIATGFFIGSPFSFDGGQTTLWNPSSGYDGFLLKLSALNGATVWSRAFAADSDNQGNGLTIDGNGDILVVGQFLGAVDLSNNTGVLPYPRPASALVNHGDASTDLYIGKFRSDGTFLWSKGFGGVGADTAFGVATDSSQNIFITGRYNYSINLGVGTMTSVSSDVFLAKLSPVGNCVWSKTFPGTGNTKVLSGLAVDSIGNVVITGYFDNSINLGGGVRNTIAAQSTTYVAKYAGSATGLNPANYLWDKIMTGTSANQSYGVTTDSANHVITTGLYMGAATIDNQTLTSVGWADIFLLNLTP